MMKKASNKAITMMLLKSWFKDFVAFVRFAKYGIMILLIVPIAAMPVGSRETLSCQLDRASAYHSYGINGVAASCIVGEKRVTIKLPSGTPYLVDHWVTVSQQKRLLTGYTYRFESYAESPQSTVR